MAHSRKVDSGWGTSKGIPVWVLDAIDWSEYMDVSTKPFPEELIHKRVKLENELKAKENPKKEKLNVRS